MEDEVKIETPAAETPVLPPELPGEGVENVPAQPPEEQPVSNPSTESVPEEAPNAA